jgi:hypothetical protein
MRLATLLVSLSLASSWAGCTPTGNGGEEEVTANQACDATSEATCRRYQDCAPWYIQYLFGDYNTCLTRVRMGCTDAFVASGATVTPKQVVDCMNAVNTASCEDWFAGRIPAACDYPAGTLSNGSTCATGNQCASESCHYGTSLCGACAAPAGAGGSCQNVDCAQGLVCAGAYTCVSEGAAGAGCDSGHPCQQHLVCINGTCSAPLAGGSACNPQASACNGVAGQVCVNNTCQAVGFAGTGQPCGLINNGFTVCAASGTCNVPQGQSAGSCMAAAADGAACNNQTGPWCMSPAGCFDGVCKLRTPASCG